MKPIETVGILGLGKMGGPIAGHLVARGFKVIGYDPVARAREQAAARGARGAASARELAQASDLVIVVVGFDSEVEEVVFGKDGALEGARPGLIVALGSTVAPRYSRRLASRLAEKNLVLLDIPLARGSGCDGGQAPDLRRRRSRRLRALQTRFQRFRVGHLPSGAGGPLARHASPQARNAGSDGLTPAGKLATLTSCRELAHGYVDVRPAGSGSEDTWRLTVT